MYDLSKNLVATVPSGQTLKPWIMLGLFNQDVNDTVQGLTLFEKAGANTGSTMLQQAADLGRDLLGQPATEGQTASFRGETRRWEMVRRPEPLLKWGEYNISNHLGAAFLQTTAVPEHAGKAEFGLRIGINCYVQVLVNNAMAYEGVPDRLPGGFGAYASFEAELLEGENQIAVGLYRIGRMAQVGFRLTLDQAVTAHTALPAGMTLDERLAIEQEVGAFRLERDVFYPEMELGPVCDRMPEHRIRIRLTPGAKDVLGGGRGTTILQETTTAKVGLTPLTDAGALQDGNYRIAIDWLDDTNEPITGITYKVKKFTPAPDLPGPENQPARRQRVLEHYCSSPEWAVIWNQVARYGLGRFDEIDEEAMRITCEHIRLRKDCADFVIQGVLRLLFWDREQQQLAPEMIALMKEAVLGFKYWVDEPGDTVMYMGSENHRLLFHVAEWMAGLLFPTEEFTNSGMRGLYHSAKGRMYITEWIRQRGRFGLDEWHSNSYYPITMAPLVNVYDFAAHEGQQKLRDMAGAALDYMLFNMASDSYRGVFGTSHGRSYGEYVKYPDLEMTSGISWMYWNQGSLIPGTEGIGTVCLATSDYQPPALLYGMANDDKQTVKSLERHGLHRLGVSSANQVVFRTPDYMLASVQDYRKGEYETSSHPAQVTLGNKNVIFWTCPVTSGEGHGLRPDFWSGTAQLPRILQVSNVMALHWKLHPLTWMTHCWFEKERFDEYRLEDKWAFCRVGDGYVGIYSQNGYELGNMTQYAGRELICKAKENTWLVECGRKANWGSFDAFCAALLAAPVRFENNIMTYESPSQGTIISGWDQDPMQEGAPVDSSAFPLVRSPWAYSRFGSGEIALSYENDHYNLWMNQ